MTTCSRANSNHQSAASAFIADDERQQVPPRCTDLPTKPHGITSQKNVTLKLVVRVLLTDRNMDGGPISTGTWIQWQVCNTDDEVRHRHGHAHHSTYFITPIRLCSSRICTAHGSKTTFSALRDSGRYVRNWELAFCSPFSNRADSTFSDATRGKHTKIHIKMGERMRNGYEYCVNSIVQHTHISIIVKYKSNSYKQCSVT